ncbi:E3 ubiquitin-protein ligase RFWD3 isoform X3 [Manihot esculenta]|uniref:Uncharacterized protein n=1 Tax=Manihot esculenta TaxID=3983 RepID=A0ACB7HFZ7_MANES|nr:E3 ubiquitin-protein ligase RFWD3 isoform X3 [Manihot esculenta]KAG8651106.1 hypothetical protein MANES_07G133120v8 [Manihot esculenta]
MTGLVSGFGGDIYNECCLPCGHVYGLSCISRWLQHRFTSTKCPQCNAYCTLKDVRKLYASPVVINDKDLREKVQSLEAEIVCLKTERADLLDVQDSLLKIQDNLLKELDKIKEKQTFMGNMSFVDTGSKPFGVTNVKEAQSVQFERGSNLSRQQLLHCTFVLENELAVEGARLFDVNVSYQNLILARRISGMGGIHMLNKINMINPHENEDIQLPPGTKAVKDLKISPCGRFTLLASLGRKLSILSMGSNEIVATYELRVPAWSCAWDLNVPHYIYAGLQNGTILVFDTRLTRHPLQSIGGLTVQSIHTIHSLVHNPTLGHDAQKLLAASSLGPCVWSAGSGERPFAVPGLDNQGFCTSLAYGPLSNNILVSYRPKFSPPPPIATANSSSSNQGSSSVPGQGILGSQVLVKRVAGSFYSKLGSTSAHLSDVQMVKSAIIEMENCYPLLAYADGVTNGLRLRELPSLTVNQNLKPHHYPILDVKYAHNQGIGVLGCASEDKLQLFSAKIS